MPARMPAVGVRTSLLGRRSASGGVGGDVVQDLAQPEHVVLVEVYRDDAAAAAHKETEHYATWRDTVAPMMAVPRSSVKFAAVAPVQPERWDTPPA